nr:retrovirus-related Pol polyprotein from transposon TNT 1-94 [Tanacetum cinerariifolium]
MFRVDRIEDRGTMHGVQVQLVMEELKTELGMLIQVKQCRLSATTAMENGVTLDEEQLLFITGGQENVVDEQLIQDLALNADNVFQADDYDAFDSDDHDHYQDAVCEHHEVHEMHDDIQPNYVVDSHTGYTSDSNMIPYDQYVKDNAVQVVQSDVFVVPNDAYMMILNDMHEPPAQHVYVITQTKLVDKSLTDELATYKE